MGVSSFTNVLHRIDKLSVHDVFKAAEAIAGERGQSGKPAMYIDASWLGYRYRNYADGGVSAVADILMILTREGFTVVVVFDPEHRHHSKIASIRRRGEREKARIQSLTHQQAIMRLSGQLNSDIDLTMTMRAEILARLKISETKMKACQKSSSIQLHPLFESNLKNKVLEMDPGDRGGSIDIHTAPYQADSFIAREALKERCDLIFCADADYAILAGAKGLMLADCSFQRGELKGLLLKSSTLLVAEKAKAAMPAGSTANLMVASQPILDGVDDARLRMAIGVALGCDVMPGGLSGMGLAAVAEVLQEYSTVESFTQNLAAKYPHIGAEVIHTFIDAWYFEPADINENGTSVYLFDEPIELDNYLFDFGLSGVTHFHDGIETFLCEGQKGQAPHQFPLALGRAGCKLCETDTCPHCATDVNNSTLIEKRKRGYQPVWHCYKCIGGDGPDDCGMTRDQLKQALIASGQVGLGDAAYHELLDMHKTIIDGKSLSPNTQVKFPLKSSAAMFNCNIGQSLVQFEFKDGGRFIHDTSLGASHVLGISKLLVAVVTMTDTHITNELTIKEKQVYSSVPDLIIRFAQGSRPNNNNGYRLLHRCIRHAMDSRTSSFDTGGATGLFFLTPEGGVGLKIEHIIAPSYRLDVQYNTKVAFTPDDLISTSCTCKAGPDNDKMHICVHALPLILLLHLFLFDGFADHYLHELCARIDTLDLTSLTQQQGSEFVAALKTVIQAGAEKHVFETMAGMYSIGEVLSQFQVGTQQRKREPPPPDPIYVVPLHQLQLRSSTKLLQLRRGDIGYQASSNKEQCTEDTGPVVLPAGAELELDADKEGSGGHSPPDYISIVAMCSAFATLLGRGDTPSLDLAGVKLLHYRADKILPPDHLARSSLVATILDELRDDAVPRTLERHWKQCKSNTTSHHHATESANDTATQGTSKFQRRVRHACCMFGGDCKGRSGFKRVPGIPSKPKEEATKAQCVRYGRKKIERQEYCNRAALKRNCESKDLRICDEHKFESVTKSFRYPLDASLSKWGGNTHTFFLPMAVGRSAIASLQNNGLGRERQQKQYLQQVTNNSWAQVTQQLSHFADPTSDPFEHIGESVLAAGGFTQHSLFKNKRKLDNIQPLRSPPPHPVVNLSVTDADVKERTDFKTLYDFLVFVAIASDGLVSNLTETKTSMTWFEEWFGYCSWLWGRECRTRKILAGRFKVGPRTFSRMLDSCLDRVDSTLNKWPRFASYEEDRALMKPKWLKNYGNMRAQMWDNTNAPLNSPSDPNINRARFSSYYNGNVAKGAIFLQFCGWQGAWELWVGSISDTDYQTRSGVFAYQQQFAESDTTSVKPFTNIVDKRYRCSLAAWRAGKQLMLQPSFARSDRRFNSHEVLHSSSVASDRSANERGVNVQKRPEYIKQGLAKHENTTTFAKAWKNSGFQCNFMYKPVL